jgi:hypothetical protein
MLSVRTAVVKGSLSFFFPSLQLQASEREGEREASGFILSRQAVEEHQEAVRPSSE